MKSYLSGNTDLSQFIRLVFGIYLLASAIYKSIEGIYINPEWSYYNISFITNFISSRLAFNLLILSKMICGFMLLVSRFSAFGALMTIVYASIFLTYNLVFPTRDFLLIACLEFTIATYLVYRYRKFYAPLFNSEILSH